jgi:hypothetical protein
MTAVTWQFPPNLLTIPQYIYLNVYWTKPKYVFKTEAYSQVSVQNPWIILKDIKYI